MPRTAPGRAIEVELERDQVRLRASRYFVRRQSRKMTAMQVPLQITVRNMQQSDALEAHIRQKVEKLAEFHPRITSCRVTVEESGKHHHQGRQFQVRIDVHVPQHEIVASRDWHEDVYVALREAFDAAKRQLEALVDGQARDARRTGAP